VENHERDVYDLGLAADLEMLKRSPVDRRRILKMGALGIGLLLAGGRSRHYRALRPRNKALSRPAICR
jgi:recombinational DNA repair ATPase RecF